MTTFVARVDHFFTYTKNCSTWKDQGSRQQPEIILEYWNPGIIEATVEVKSRSTTSMTLSVNGKNISPEWWPYDSGDIDLFGYETPSLISMQKEWYDKIQFLKTLDLIGLVRSDESLDQKGRTTEAMIIRSNITGNREDPLYQTERVLFVKYHNISWKRSFRLGNMNYITPYNVFKWTSQYLWANWDID